MSAPLSRINSALEGRYRIERTLGEGGMATVYLARELKHDRNVAVKVLRPDLAAALGADRFLREIETTARLRHPHILPLYDSGGVDGLLFYVMPFVEGPSLRQRLDDEKQLPVEEALTLLGEIVDGLEYAHEQGVIHRDMKPGNVLLEDGHAVVADFGVAQAVSESGGEGLTETGTVLGTPKYMSPEQANAESVDARTDLYSLGCVAYEMLAGTPPFSGPTALVLMARHALDPVPSLRTARPAVSEAVAEAVKRALAKTPADRFGSVREWHEALVGDGAADREPRAPALDLPLPPRPSIAIVPFESLGADAGRDYFADGIRLGIQSTLVQLSGLFLVNASALNAYRGEDVSAESVARELDVRYILEGAVQQAGERIRVTVQLTDTEVGRTVWAERYDRRVDDVFDLQDEITREVISSLNVKLVQSEAGRGFAAKLTAPQAREYFYRGMSHIYEGTEKDTAAAREVFTKLYEVEPDSVLGPSIIALSHWLDVFAGWTDAREESVRKAIEWADKAMEYEDNNGIGHVVYGHLRLLEREYEEAFEVCSEGVELRQCCPVAHGLMGIVLTYLGKPAGAIREVREALSLERIYPVWLLSTLATAYRDEGDLDRSVSAADQALRFDPQARDALLVLCSDHQLAGRQDKAERIADRVMELDPGFRLSTYAQSQPYKDEATLERVIGSLREAGLPA